MLVAGRLLRDIKSAVSYPLWILKGRPPPDNHFRKKSRIIRLCREYGCDTFIETGTFYGQMVNVARRHFKKVMSVELFAPLYQLNRAAFASYSHVTIFQGSSAERLREMMDDTHGRILFWLDGHYSGEGTARGDQVTPIIAELEIIRAHTGRDHCILIDDARLFTGREGYPPLDEAEKALRSINSKYNIRIDGDCIVALP